MTRSDSGTKERIIEAANKVLSEQGYDKASMKQIAKEAGVAQGLINYYFPSKEELLFQLFDKESCRYCEEMSKVSEIPMSENFIQNALKVTSNIVDEHPELQRLRYELFAIGLRSENGRVEIGKILNEGRAQVIQEMSRLPANPTTSENEHSLAAIIVAVLDGLALQKMTDPNFDSEAAYQTFGSLLELYVTAQK